MTTVGRAQRRTLKTVGAATAALSLLAVAGCSAGTSGDSGDGGGDGDVTIEFAQWWEPELPDGEFRALIDKFEEANPEITVDLVSGPYASTKEQLFAGAASGTMPDVVGLDGAWVNDFASQGVIADLTALMEEYDYDDSELASQIQVDGSTYMVPVVNFVYPMFTNDTLLAEAGVTAPPTTRTEFADAAAKVAALGGDASGWVLPLSLEAPNGVQNDVMSWVWASGGSMLADGQPDLTNADVTSAVDFIGGLWDDGVVASGSFTMKEQDKVEEFTNGRVGMMIDSLAHINLIRETNPDLKFSISALPAEDGYDGERGIPYASWGRLQAGRVPDERGDQLRAVDHGQGVPRKLEVCSGLRRRRRAVPEGLRDLPGGIPGERVHRPAGGGRADASPRRAAAGRLRRTAVDR
jgi:multiple sugar transport system substrate-binding protein